MQWSYGPLPLTGRGPPCKNHPFCHCSSRSRSRRGAGGSSPSRAWQAVEISSHACVVYQAPNQLRLLQGPFHASFSGLIVLGPVALMHSSDAASDSHGRTPMASSTKTDGGLEGHPVIPLRQGRGMAGMGQLGQPRVGKSSKPNHLR